MPKKPNSYFECELDRLEGESSVRPEQSVQVRGISLWG